jgi:hypothetical protein
MIPGSEPSDNCCGECGAPLVGANATNHRCPGRPS